MAAERRGRLRIVVGNTVISLAGQVVTWVSTLVLTMAYGRFLGPNGFGEIYLAVTLVGLIGFPLEFGFNQQIIREVAQTPERAHRVLSSALILKAALWAPMCALLLLATWVLRYSAEERMLVLLSGCTLLVSAMGAAFGSMHIAVHRNFAPVVGSVLEKSLDAAVAFALLRLLNVGVITIGFVLLGGALVNATWQAIWFFHLERPTLAFDAPLMREIVRTSIPFLIYGVLGVIYYRVDTVMLGAMDGDTVVGWYGAGYRIFDTLIFLPSLVMSTIMYPLMARLSKHEPEAFKLAVEKSTNFLLVVGMPLAAGLGAAAPAIVGFLYHHTEFSHTAPVLEALAPGLILLYLNAVISSIIISVKRERLMTWMAAGALVVNVSLNLLLIPRYHELAAAGVTSFTELVLLGAGLYLMPHELIPRGSVPTLLKALVASMAMVVVILAMARLSIILILPCAAATYALAGVCLRLIPRSDVEALIGAVKSKAGSQQDGVAASSAEQPEMADAALAVAEIAPAVKASGARRRQTRRTGSSNAARLEWLQAPAKAAERARLVTRARSTSAPLLASQRLSPARTGNREEQRTLVHPSPPARRRKAERQGRSGRKRAA